MGEDGVHQVFLGGFQRPADDIALDQLGHFGADHMRAQKLACPGVEDGLDQAFRLAQGDGLAIADEGEAAHLDVVACGFGLGLGQADAGDLRVAIGAAGDAIGFDGVRMAARDEFGHHDAFVAGLVGEPGCTCDVTDGIEPVHAGAAVGVCHDMGAVNLDAQFLQPQSFGIADDAHGGDDRVECHFLNLAVFFDMGGHRAFGAVELLDCGFFKDRHALLLEGLAGEGGDFLVLDGQDAVHHLDHGRVGAQRVVEAGEFDADGARADDQQLFRHPGRDKGVAVGPDQIAVRFEPRQFAGARAGGQHDVGGGQVFGALVGGDGHAALGGDRCIAHDHGDLVLLHQMADARGELLGHPARAFHDGIQIVGDIVGAEAEFLGPVHQVEHFGGAQHRLGRDAAPVEADAAQILALDNHDLEAQLRGADRCDISPRPRADHDQVKCFGRHARPPIPKLV